MYKTVMHSRNNTGDNILKNNNGDDGRNGSSSQDCGENITRSREKRKQHTNLSKNHITRMYGSRIVKTAFGRSPLGRRSSGRSRKRLV